MKRWLTSSQAADKLGFKTRSAFHAFVKKRGVPYVRFGTSLRFSDDKLDAFMEMLSRRRQYDRPQPATKIEAA